jgi:hypothetical protein
MCDAQGLLTPYFAVVGRRRTGDNAKHRGLARAISAHQTDPFAGFDLEIDVFEQR